MEACKREMLLLETAFLKAFLREKKKILVELISILPALETMSFDKQKEMIDL